MTVTTGKTLRFGFFIAAACLLAVATSRPLQAAPIPLFSTGVDGNGVELTAGSVDPHYTVQAGSPGYDQFNYLAGYDPNTYVGSAAVVPTGFDWGLHGQATTISFNNSAVSGYQPFTYRTTFDLTGFDPNSVVLNLSLYADDRATLALNGVLLPSTFLFYQGLTPLAAITSGFVAGLNTLDIVSYNEGGPGGVELRVDSAEATAVPEPASMVLLGTGLLGLARARRRR